jgi:hypothetical protein
VSEAEVTRRKASLTVRIVAGLALLVSVSLGLSGWALYDRFDQTNSRRLEQQALNHRLQHLALDYCLEIEALKTARRERAVSDYQNRSRTYRLLHLEPTPELERAFKQQRDGILAKYARKPCPRPEEGR